MSNNGKERGYSLDGNAIVAKMGTLNITGNVIPMEWFKHIKRENGKPYTDAIILLADIVYWYRPIETRDEQSGQVVGFRKKFAAKFLQRDYNGFIATYGYTKNQVREAIQYLENLGVIKCHWWGVVTKKGMKLNNVLFIELVFDKFVEVTFDPSPKIIEEGWQKIIEEGYEEIIGEPPQFKSDTNTEITTETTDINASEKSDAQGELPSVEGVGESSSPVGELIEQPVSDDSIPEEFRGPAPAQPARRTAGDFRAGVEAALLSNAKRQAAAVNGTDVSGYPEDVRETISVICKLYKIKPPKYKVTKKGASNNPSADWIVGARNVNEACAEFGLELIRLHAEQYWEQVRGNNGIPKWTVSRPGSLTNSLTGLAGQLRAEAEMEPAGGQYGIRFDN